ncbi:MAG: hypothetical protein E6J15_02725 [Chloroflexi bacterium]|nr:MAG: hypothetical protein E6J15_02725 [Chloroflexota bacterium]
MIAGASWSLPSWSRPSCSSRSPACCSWGRCASRLRGCERPPIWQRSSPSTTRTMPSSRGPARCDCQRMRLTLRASTSPASSSCRLRCSIARRTRSPRVQTWRRTRRRRRTTR